MTAGAALASATARHGHGASHGSGWLLFDGLTLRRWHGDDSNCDIGGGEIILRAMKSAGECIELALRKDFASSFCGVA